MAFDIGAIEHAYGLSNDYHCLASNIYREARNQSLSGKVAVGQVVLNRVDNERFPDTICSVVKQTKFYPSGRINLDDEFLARNPQDQLSNFTNLELDVQPYEGELFDVSKFSNTDINIYKNPGHTKGSISYEFSNLGVVFTGDFVFAQGIGRTDLYSGNTSEMKESINKIFLNIQHIKNIKSKT